MQFVERADWIKAIHVQYLLGIDGISLLLVLLTSLLTFLAMLSSWKAVKDRLKEYYVFLLLLEVGMIGVFVSLDLVLFYVFWEVMLVPMYFLIGIWGGERRLYAAIKFFLYTLFGSVMMLVGILVLYSHYHTFDVLAILQTGSFLPAALQTWVFLAFFLGFAIKVPMFPFHTWLPDAHVEAPTAGSVILAGVLLKMGTYGFVRFSLPLLPGGVAQVRAARRRPGPDLHRLRGPRLAHAEGHEEAHRLLLGLPHGLRHAGHLHLHPDGRQGRRPPDDQPRHLDRAPCSSSSGVLYERRHTRLISEFGGLSARMPVYAAVFLIITMSSIGLPGLNGFIGEFMILMGAWTVNSVWAAVAATGIILGAAYMLWLYQRVMFGKLENPANQSAQGPRRSASSRRSCPLVVLAFWIGIYPQAVPGRPGQARREDRPDRQSRIIYKDIAASRRARRRSPPTRPVPEAR